MSRTGLASILFLALLAPLAAAAEPRAEAREVMDLTVADVLAVLGDDALSSAEKRSRIEAIALERFDFEIMSKLVLKRDWRKFSDAQKTEFVVEFRTYLAKSYGSRITRYNQEAVDMAGERLEPRGDVTVLTRIEGGGADGVEIDYRVRNRDGQWRIIDVVIEGISLVSNFRSQFADVIRRGGPTELLARLRQKNAESAAQDEVAAEGDDGPAGEAPDEAGRDAETEPETATAL